MQNLKFWQKAMKTLDPREDDFLMDHFNELSSFALEYRDKLGYTEVFVTEDYTIESIDFTEGQFFRKEFSKMPDDYPPYPETDDEFVFRLYFKIFYRSDETIRMFYRTYVILLASDYSKLKNL